MSDIDEELLALAGDASSDEEDTAPVTATRTASDSPDANTPSGSKGTAKKARGRRAESEEEGEASSRNSSPGSQRSAPMDESESDSDSGPAMFDDGDRYPLEGKFVNSSDRAEILAMPEIKREEILAERSMEIERDRQNRALRQLLHAREAEQKRGDKKRKAGNADLDENQRKTSRQRTKVGGGRVGEASSGIDSLKRARDEKADRLKRRKEDLERNGGHRANNHDQSDDDAGADSELEWDDGKAKHGRSASPPTHSPPCELPDVQKVSIGRTKFAKLCFYPGFEDAYNGGFVRVSVGADKATGDNVYRMAQIMGFEEGKPYALEKENGQTFVTTQYVTAAHGKAVRPWPFFTCSNSPITEAEFKRYMQTCAVEKVNIPTRRQLATQVGRVDALVNRSRIDAELTEKRRRSGALAAKYKSVDRNKLNKRLNQAKLLGDVDRQEEIKAELAALEGPKLAFGTSLHKTPAQTGPRTLSQQDRLAILNQENRRKNNEEIKAAQLREMREQRRIEAAIARGEDAVVDHSRRVRTRAVLKHDVNKESGSGASTPAKVATPKLSPKKESGVLPHMAKLHAEMEKQKQNGGIATMRRPLCDDDIIGAIDLGIEIEL
ncbi:hypothetical protein VE04_09159 [Pseudogymnoascus sp. 24MN13]|nr:hypothetical protein VE04_09159 [Pseudogymnoascus sp. 24MN13]